MDLDLRRLRYFVAVADHLHFRRAAEAIPIAQPALSRQIRALEQDLGVTLFDRDRRATTLTPAGRQLLEDARPLLANADAARRRVQRAARGSDRLVLGFRAGITVTAATRAFAQARPDVTVDVVRMEWDDQEELLRSGRVDVGVVRPPLDDRGLRLLPLYSEDQLAVLPASHPLARRRSLRSAELAGERRLRYTDIAPGAEAPLRSVEEKLEHVAAGHGIIVLPRSATAYYQRPDVKYIKVLDAEPTPVLLAWEAGRRSKALIELIAIARDTLGGTVVDAA